MNLFRQFFIFSISCLVPYIALAQFSKITDVSLSFSPTNGGETVFANAEIGLNGLEVTNSITLEKGTQYDMSISLFSDTTSLNEGLIAEGDQYLFFFGWTDGLFVNPTGDGNIDNRADPVNYADSDTSGLPIGFQTDWEVDCEPGTLTGDFRVVFQFQPDTKSDTSTVEDGSEQFDLSWDISLVDPADTTKCAGPAPDLSTLITDVELAIFTPGTEDTIFVSAQDPDGRGASGLQAQGDIELDGLENYRILIRLQNTVDAINMTQFLQDSADNYQVFFEFTSDNNGEFLFTDPAGDGNIDDVNDPLNYNDVDSNGLPLGLSTEWQAGEGQTGSFRVVIQEQIGIKSGNSSANDGTRVMDVSWNTIVDEVTSISDLIETEGLNVWPNPLKDQLRWEVEGHSVKKIVLLDIFGREAFVQDRPSSTIRLNHLANGTYIMLAYGERESQIWRSRVMVQK